MPSRVVAGPVGSLNGGRGANARVTLPRRSYLCQPDCRLVRPRSVLARSVATEAITPGPAVSVAPWRANPRSRPCSISASPSCWGTERTGQLGARALTPRDSPGCQQRPSPAACPRGIGACAASQPGRAGAVWTACGAWLGAARGLEAAKRGARRRSPSHPLGMYVSRAVRHASTPRALSIRTWKRSEDGSSGGRLTSLRAKGIHARSNYRRACRTRHNHCATVAARAGVVVAAGEVFRYG